MQNKFLQTLLLATALVLPAAGQAMHKRPRDEGDGETKAPSGSVKVTPSVEERKAAAQPRNFRARAIKIDPEVRSRLETLKLHRPIDNGYTQVQTWCGSFKIDGLEVNVVVHVGGDDGKSRIRESDPSVKLRVLSVSEVSTSTWGNTESARWLVEYEVTGGGPDYSDQRVTGQADIRFENN